MTTQFVIQYINKKLKENENYVHYSFYELRVKNDLTEADVYEFLTINKNYFENKGYQVYFTGDTFEYNDETIRLEPNDLMVAVRMEG